MAKIKITENELKQIIEESVNKIVSEAWQDDFGRAVGSGFDNAKGQMQNAKGFGNKMKAGVSGFKKGYNAEQDQVKLDKGTNYFLEIIEKLEKNNIIDHDTKAKYENMLRSLSRGLMVSIDKLK